VIIFVLCAVVLRSLVGALLVLTPLALAVFVILGAMGWSGVCRHEHGAITAMGVSIGADFAIYSSSRPRGVAQRTCARRGLRNGLRTSGKARSMSRARWSPGISRCRCPASACGATGLSHVDDVALSALAACGLLPAIIRVLQPRFLTRPRPWPGIGEATVVRVAASSPGPAAP
jgi:predicted RND superfamily exporter protein